LIIFILICLLPLTSWAEEIYFYHTDNFDTPMVMTDMDGEVVWQSDELPFGEEYETVENPIKNNRRFLGKELDEESGLIYMEARYLDPKTGRFNRTDPVGLVDPATGQVNQAMLLNPQRQNRYVYGLNNPYRYVDPNGNFPKDLENSSYNPYELEDTGARVGTGNLSGKKFGKALWRKITGKGRASKGTTSRAARREVMREQGIPTTQQPLSQSQNMSGKSYEYEVSKSGGGPQIKSVQQQTMDVSHPNQGHWEAGSVKTDPISGQVRMNQYGRPKLTNDKSKRNYHD